MSEPAILAIVAILASAVGALIWIIKYMFDKILPILESLKDSVDRNTKATQANDEYLRERNGRDSKMWIEVRDSLKVISENLQNNS